MSVLGGIFSVKTFCSWISSCKGSGLRRNSLGEDMGRFWRKKHNARYHHFANIIPHGVPLLLLSVPCFRIDKKNQRREAPQLIDVFSEIKIPVLTASPRLSTFGDASQSRRQYQSPFSTSEPLYHVNDTNLKPQVDKRSWVVTLKKIA